MLRAFSTLEGIGRALDPDYKFVAVAQPYATQLLELQVSLPSTYTLAVSCLLPCCPLSAPPLFPAYNPTACYLHPTRLPTPRLPPYTPTASLHPHCLLPTPPLPCCCAVSAMCIASIVLLTTTGFTDERMSASCQVAAFVTQSLHII